VPGTNRVVSIGQCRDIDPDGNPDGSTGVRVYNNTILSEIGLASSSNLHVRNNLILGEQSAPTLFAVNTLTNDSSSDHNGFRPNPGAAALSDRRMPSCRTPPME